MYLCRLPAAPEPPSLGDRPSLGQSQPSVEGEASAALPRAGLPPALSSYPSLGPTAESMPHTPDDTEYESVFASDSRRGRPVVGEGQAETGSLQEASRKVRAVRLNLC
jgi:hypothetical protein